MRLLCDINLFFKSIGRRDQKNEFQKIYQNQLAQGGAIVVDLTDHKTLTQLGAVWRDWTIVGRLLDCSANAIYYRLMKSKECLDIFFRKDERGNWEFNTLSSFDKKRTGELIERYRPVLQNWVDESHAEHIEIKWSKREDEE